MTDSTILHLIARDVDADTPPLDGAGAYVNTFDGGEQCDFDLNMTASLASILAELKLDDFVNTDPKQTHMMMPRYELVDETATSSTVCAWATLIITPMAEDDDGISVVVEATTPSWLDLDFERGVRRTLGVFLEAARSIVENGEAAS